MKILVAFIVGSLLTIIIGSHLLIKNEDEKADAFRFSIRYSYFTGCVDGLVATSPFTKEEIVLACNNAADIFIKPIDDVVNSEL